MQTIATNIRFPQDEYREIKLLAFMQGKSTAALIRDAVNLYKRNTVRAKSKIALVERFRKLSVKINIPVIDLVREGRKFE